MSERKQWILYSWVTPAQHGGHQSVINLGAFQNGVNDRVYATNTIILISFKKIRKAEKSLIQTLLVITEPLNQNLAKCDLPWVEIE